MFRKKSPRKIPGWMRLLTDLAIFLGFITTLSYGAGAHIAVRYLNPRFGAWWNAYEFAMVECSAAALGMLIGIRIGARLVHGLSLKRKSSIASAIAGALVLPAVAKIGAEAARYRFTHGASANAWLIDRFGYDVGMFLDKLLSAWVYSIKISLFALPIGMILFGLAVAVFMSASEPQVDTGPAISK
jgi:hypothetical protein